MAAYVVQQAYTARRDGVTFGPWSAGDNIDLDPGDAEWVERDSPGTLAAAKAEPERQAKPPADRQHRGGRNRGA